MRKPEAAFQRLFSRWLKNRWHSSAAFELKRSLTNSISFDAVKEHQRIALLQAKGQGLTYKIPDDASGAKPFDCFQIAAADAYVVVAFGEKLDEFFLIPIETWIDEEKKSARKSLTRERATDIGERVCVHD